MRWRIALAICRKELLETVRDRRTMVVMLFLPVVLYPLLLVGFSQIIAHQVTKLDARPATIRIWGHAPRDFLDRLRRENRVTVVEATDPTVTIPETLHTVPLAREPRSGLLPSPVRPDDETLAYDPALEQRALAAFKDQSADLVILLPRDFETALAAGETAKLIVFYDETNEIAHFVRVRLDGVLREYRRQLGDARLAAHPELPAGFARPFTWIEANVAPAEKRGAYFAGRILPMMMMIMVLLGAFYPAVDLTAGEKERGTLQTLLTAPALPAEIILGKFITVFAVSMLSALANLGSMALAIVYLLESGTLAENLNFHLAWSTGLLLFVELVPVALLFSALMLAVSIFARSFKEAQNYLTPVYLVIIIPVVLTGLPGMNLTLATAWLPVINITLLIKDLLIQVPAPGIILSVLAANFVYSALTLALAVHIFKQEQVLLGGQGAFGDLFREQTDRGRVPTPGLALAVFGGGLVLLFYVGTWLQRPPHFLAGLLVTQYVLLLAPALLVCRGLGFDCREVLSLRRPSARGWLAALLLGGTAWLVVNSATMWLQNLVLRQPEELVQAKAKLLGLSDSHLPLAVILVVFALTPAICEEVFFRGLVLGGLRQGLPKWPAIILTGLFFGVFHLDLYVIFPITVVGILMTLIVWQTRSLYAGMLFHLLFNGVQMTVAKLNLIQGVRDGQPGTAFWMALAVGGVLFLAGLALLFREPAGTPSSGADTGPTPG